MQTSMTTYYRTSSPYMRPLADEQEVEEERRSYFHSRHHRDNGRGLVPYAIEEEDVEEEENYEEEVVENVVWKATSSKLRDDDAEEEKWRPSTPVSCAEEGEEETKATPSASSPTLKRRISTEEFERERVEYTNKQLKEAGLYVPHKAHFMRLRLFAAANSTFRFLCMIALPTLFLLASIGFMVDSLSADPAHVPTKPFNVMMPHEKRATLESFSPQYLQMLEEMVHQSNTSKTSPSLRLEEQKDEGKPQQEKQHSSNSERSRKSFATCQQEPAEEPSAECQRLTDALLKAQEKVSQQADALAQPSLFSGNTEGKALTTILHEQTIGRGIHIFRFAYNVLLQLSTRLTHLFGF
ncbi:hypothetical protein QOT17_005782 [Balamuthia mandrillaris]